MRRRTIALASVLAAGIVIVGAMVMLHAKSQTLQHEGAAETNEEPQPDRAEQTMKALAAAYPHIIERAEFRDGDWAVLLRGTWYYYSDGRLLPEGLLESADEYGRIGFMTNYQRDLPPWSEPSPEQADRYRGRGRNRSNENENAPRLRRYPFHEDLFQIHSREEASTRVQPASLLGKAITIHPDIAELLSLVERRIMDAAQSDPAVQQWVANIGEVHGWNWRNVADSASRSRHSYGVAIDILPKSLDGKETYWQWAAQRGKEWWNIPYEERYHPPDAVVKAFEAYGFMWGGKWAIFDTMHFEYRPEAFILSGLELATLMNAGQDAQ